MTHPRMIMFDYGYTPLYKPGWDSLRGENTYT